MEYPQQFWQRVFRGYGCRTREEAAAVRRWVKRRPDFSVVMKNGVPATKSLRSAGKELFEAGYTTDKGTEYLPQHVKGLALSGLAWSAIWVCDQPRTQKNYQRIRQLMDRFFARKGCYSRSTTDDPYLHSRLEWWRFRKVGRKPNSSWYEKRATRKNKRAK